MKRNELIKSWGFSPSVVTAIIRAREIEELPASVRHFAEKRERGCYHSPGWDDLQGHVLNGYLETFGLESMELQGKNGAPIRVEYLNTGDTYALTLCRVSHPPCNRPYLIAAYGPWHVASWGYYAEKYESQGCF